MSLSKLVYGPNPTYIGVDGNSAWVIMICAGGKLTLKEKGSDKTYPLLVVNVGGDIECSRSIGDGKYLVVLGNQDGIYIIKNPTDKDASMLLSIPDNAFPTKPEMSHGILCLPCLSSGPSKKKFQFLTCHLTSVPILWTVREGGVEARPLNEYKNFTAIGEYTFCATSPNEKIGMMIDADNGRFNIWKIVAPTQNNSVPLVKCLPVAGLEEAMEDQGIMHVAIGNGGWVAVTTVGGPMFLFPLPSDGSEDEKKNETQPFFQINDVKDMEAIYVTKDGSIIGFSNPSKTTSETHLYKRGSGADGKPCLTLTESKRWDDKPVKLLLPMPDTNGKVQLYFGDDSTSTWPNDRVHTQRSSGPGTQTHSSRKRKWDGEEGKRNGNESVHQKRGSWLNPILIESSDTDDDTGCRTDKELDPPDTDDDTGCRTDKKLDPPDTDDDTDYSPDTPSYNPTSPSYSP